MLLLMDIKDLNWMGDLAGRVARRGNELHYGFLPYLQLLKILQPSILQSQKRDVIY